MYKVRHSKSPPSQVLRGNGENMFFCHSLIFFTFARRTKKITFFFVRNTTKSCNIFLHFHFLELKSTFSIFRFLHSISTPKNEEMNKKSAKNSLFFYNFCQKFIVFYNFCQKFIVFYNFGVFI